MPRMADPRAQERSMTAIDQAYAAVRAGDPRGFEAWMRLVELPLRASLRSFAMAVDVEAIMQEGLLRMWQLAPTLALEGSDASLRYAARMMRNLALAEARRLRRVSATDLDDLERLSEQQIDPAPIPDPALRRLIRRCLDALPQRPRAALRARLESGGRLPDRALAEQLAMRLNTFHQNIGRARQLMRDCLQRHGVAPEEITP
jgi:RNA polymerase sigma-70 factor (ECF subfamily)